MKKQNHGIRIIVSIMSALLLLAALSSCPAPIAAVQPETPTPVVSAGNNQISVSWTAVSNATGYEVWYNTADSMDSAAKFGGDVMSTSTVVTGLANGTVYYVWLRAKNTVLASGFSPSASAVAGFFFTNPPTLAVGDGQIDVSWTSLTNATAYEVWYGTSSSPTAAVKFGGDVTGTSATLTGLTNGIAYYFWINAKQLSGKSGFSPSANVRPFAASALTINAWYPSSLIAGQEKWYSFDAVSGRSYGIYWDDGYGGSGAYTCYYCYVSGYHADRSTAYFTDYSYGYSSPKTMTATATETVYIKVKGSSTSVAGTFAVKAVIPGPGTPTLVPGAGQIDVSWTALTGATAYEVWYGTTNNTASATQSGGDIAGTSSTITGLTNGTRYYVWVRAKVTEGYTNFSSSSNACPFIAQALTFNTWTPGSFAADGEQWYSFDTVAGTSYKISWDDAYNGSGTYTCYYTYVSAYRANRSTAYFTDYNYGYSSPRTISATASETVYIKVKGSSSSVSGTFAVKVSIPGPNTPTLAPGNGLIDVSWSALTGATAYEVWYNTANNVATATQSGGDIAGTSTSITGLTNAATYYVWVRAKIPAGYTDYSSPANARPFIAQALTFNAWTPGSLAAGGEQWYSFDTVAGNSYKISWDDAYNGSGAYTCYYTYVSAYHANRATAYFTDDIYGYSSPLTISATASETVYIKVRGSSSSVTGTYAVKASIPGPNTPTLAPGNGLIDVNWSALTGATAYEVWYNTANNVATATQFGGDIAGTSTSITGLTSATTYYVWVRAKIATGYTDYSSSANARPFIAQTLTFNTWTPGNLAAGSEQWYSFDTVAGNSYQIYWDDAYHGSGAYTCYYTYVSAYHANRATAYFTDYNSYSSASMITATASETVYIKVKGSSSSVTGTYAVKASIPGPNTPTLAPGNGQIDVSWSALTGATAYEVWYNTANNVTTATQSGGDIAGTSTSITGLGNATTYYVWVRAKIAAGYTDYSSPANARPFIAQALTFNAWTSGSLAAGDEQWYSFDAVAGNSYKISWDDSHGSGSYTCNYPYISAYRANRSTAYFTDYYFGFGSSTTIWPSASETVYIKVRGSSSSVTGTYAVKASIPGPNTPTLAPGNGLIDVSWSAVTGATAYEVWYNTANNVATATQSGGDIAGTSTSITGLTNATTYYVWVRAKIATGYTDYSSSTNTRPFIAQALTFNAWTPGSLAAGGEQWYSFNASAGKSYKISWDDSYNGSGSYTCYTYVSAYRANRLTAYFTDYVNGYSSPRTISATASETVYIKVKGNSSSASGTFAVKATLPGPGTPTLAPGNGLIDVGWPALTGATAYEVWYNTANNIATATQSGGDIAGTSTSITGLTNGATYYVWVRAKVAEGYTDFSASAGITWQSLNLNIWTASSLGAYCEYWYSFSGASGTAYNIYWDDQYNGSGAYTCSVRVSAYRADRTTAYFTSQYNGYSSPRTLTAAATETVYLKVVANSSGSQGTFAVKAVAAGPAAPALTSGNGQIDVTWNAVPSATAYEVWYGTVNSPSSAGQFGGDVTGVSTTITGLTNGIRYYVWVRAKISGGTTDFSPSANTVPNIVNILTLSVWTPGSLTAGGEGWYSFTALSGTTYQIYWDDYYSGSGAYTCDVRVSAYHSDRTTAYFTSLDYAYSTPRTITPSVSEVVYLKVAGYSSGSAGTFAVRVVQQ